MSKSSDDLKSILQKPIASQKESSESIDSFLLRVAQQQNISEINKMLASLVKEGADRINIMDSNKKTLLHYAIERGNVDLVRALIARGADVNKVDKEGKTPLHYTLDAKTGAAGTESALLLLKAGADIKERHLIDNGIYDDEFPLDPEDDFYPEDNFATEVALPCYSVYEYTQNPNYEKNEDTIALIERYNTLSTIGSVALGVGCVIGVLAAVVLVTTVVAVSHGVALLPLLAVCKSLFVPSTAVSAAIGIDVLASTSLLAGSFGVFKGAEKLMDTPDQRPQSFAALAIGWFKPSPKEPKDLQYRNSTSNSASSSS